MQRKELKDFVASVQDGRLSREVGQMQSLKYALLVVEGAPRWALDGALMIGGRGTRWTEKAHHAYLWSVQSRGIMVASTMNADGTVQCVRRFEEWVKNQMAGKHRGLDTRPGPVVQYGKPGNRDFERHVLCGLPGMGPERADLILDKFGGVPLGWTVTREQMLEVKGIGKGLVERWWQMLGEK